MRIWDLDPSCLCRQHLLGEHRELHGLWNIVLHGKMGYSQHPETKRWVGKLAALHARHEALVVEMTKRGYAHNSPLPAPPNDMAIQNEFIDEPKKQRELLKNKSCPCPLDHV